MEGEGRGGGGGGGKGRGGERQCVCVREGGGETLRTYSKANTYMHACVIPNYLGSHDAASDHGAPSLSPIHVLHLPDAFLYPDILVLVCRQPRQALELLPEHGNPLRPVHQRPAAMLVQQQRLRES